MPVDKNVFRKMVFCDEIFRFISLEETLFFTSLDIDLNSFKRAEDVSEDSLLAMTEENLK